MIDIFELLQWLLIAASLAFTTFCFIFFRNLDAKYERVQKKVTALEQRLMNCVDRELYDSQVGSMMTMINGMKTGRSFEDAFSRAQQPTSYAPQTDYRPPVSYTPSYTPSYAPQPDFRPPAEFFESTEERNRRLAQEADALSRKLAQEAEEQMRREQAEAKRAMDELIDSINRIKDKDRMRWSDKVRGSFPSVQFANRIMSGDYRLEDEPTDLSNMLFAAVNHGDVTYLVPFPGDYAKSGEFYMLPVEQGTMQIKQLAEIVPDGSSRVAVARKGLLVISVE